MNVRHASTRATPIGGTLLACLLAVFLGTVTAQADNTDDAARAHYDRAAEHVEASNLRAAAIELKNALQRDPAHAPSRLMLGEVYLSLGDGAAAEKELRAAGRHGIEASRTRIPLGEALLLQGRFREVLDGPAADGAPPEQAYDVMLLRGAAHGGLGDTEAARGAYEAAVALRPADARGYLGLARLDFAAGDFAAADARAAEALERDPALAEARLLQAEARRLNGDADAAVALFGQLLEAGDLPPATRLRALLGRTSALIALGRDSEALKDIAAAQAIAPGTPLAAYLQAVIEVRRQDFPAARRALESATTVLADFAPAQFLFGIVHYAAGDMETARSALARYLRTQPRHLQARKLLAATQLHLNAVEDALRTIEPARSEAPDDPQVLLLVGNAYLRSGRADEAAVLLQRAAELAPRDPRVLGQLAISHMATGQRDEASAAINATLDLGADASALGYALAFTHLKSGEFDDALRVTRDLRQRFPQSVLAAHLEGGAHAALGQFDEARASFEAVLAIDPTFHQARANLAALKARAGDITGAEADYRTILAADGKNREALMGMAGLSANAGDHAATELWLKRAVEAAPGDLNAALALAEHYASEGNPEAAVAAVEQLSRRQPEDPQVLLVLARTQSRAGHTAAAVATYQRLVAATGGSAEARLLLAEAQLAAGDLAAAQVSYEGLKESEADNPVVWNNLAWLYQQAGDERTVAHGERALELAPTQPAIMDTLGWILLEEGQLDRATALLRQAHQAAPGAGDIAYHYAAALHRGGDARGARDLLRATLDSGRPFSARAEAIALLDQIASQTQP